MKNTNIYKKINTLLSKEANLKTSILQDFMFDIIVENFNFNRSNKFSKQDFLDYFSENLGKNMIEPQAFLTDPNIELISIESLQHVINTNKLISEISNLSAKEEKKLLINSNNHFIGVKIRQSSNGVRMYIQDSIQDSASNELKQILSNIAQGNVTIIDYSKKFQGVNKCFDCSISFLNSNSHAEILTQQNLSKNEQLTRRYQIISEFIDYDQPNNRLAQLYKKLYLYSLQQHNNTTQNSAIQTNQNINPTTQEDFNPPIKIVSNTPTATMQSTSDIEDSTPCCSLFSTVSRNLF